jgi:hypothetical protein
MAMRTSPGRILPLCLVLLAAAAVGAAALDLGVETWVSNLGFRTDRASTDTTLPGGDYFWGVTVYGSQTVNDSVKVEAGFYSDPILRNTTRTIFTYDARFLSVGIGPIFGLFNDFGTPVKSGISASVKLEYPGVVFFYLRSDSSIGGSLVQTGDYSQELTEIVLGAYLPHAICTLGVRTRSFEQKADSQNIADSLTEYTFATEMFKKNVPYRLRIWLAYDDLSRSYIAASTTTSTLGSLLLGTRVEASLPGSLSLTAGFEGNIYSFGLGTLTGGDSSFLFRTYAGLKVRLDRNF